MKTLTTELFILQKLKKKSNNRGKSGKDQSKSMKELIDNENYSDIKYGIKFLSGNIGITDKVKTFPHFCMFLLKRYIEETT